MKFRRGRRTRREEIQAVNSGHRLWGALAGKPEVAESLCRELPKQRAPRTRSASNIPLERDVLKTVIQALRYDPRVARVDRNQSGVFQDGARFIRVGTKGKLDLTVYLKSGRYAEIEVKRPGEKPKPHQQARIDEIRAQGGISGYCWSVESALALLP